MDRGGEDRRAEHGRGFAPLSQFGVLQVAQQWLQRFNGDDLRDARAPALAGGQSAGAKTRAPHVNGECDDAAAPPARADDSDAPKGGEDKDAKPTGPEPIYFGF